VRSAVGSVRGMEPVGPLYRVVSTTAARLVSASLTLSLIAVHIGVS